MKRTLLVLVLALFTLTSKSFTAKTRIAANPLATLLVEFESNLKWSAVVDNWKTARAAWVKSTNACTDAASVAKKLVELEVNTKWKDVHPKWKVRNQALETIVDVTNHFSVILLFLELRSF